MDYRDIDLQTSFEIQVTDKEEVMFTEEDEPLKINFMQEERKQEVLTSEESSMEIVPL